MATLVAAVGKRVSVVTTAVALVLACVRCGGDGFTGVAPAEEGGAGGEGTTNGAVGGLPGDNEGGTVTVTPGGGSAGTGSGGTTSLPGGEAGQAGDGNVPITGEHHGYVVDSLKLPTTLNEARSVAFDVDGNGEVENQFGSALASLVAQGFDSNEAVAEGIQRGEAILLANLQASSLSSAKGAALSTFFGKNPSPAACTGELCGQHLLGTASFLLAEAPEGAPCTGKITASTFSCEGGALPVRLGLPGVVLDFTLQHARADLTGLTDGGFASGRLGGAISAADMNERVFPALHAVAAAVVERDCSGTPPGCGCSPNSSGAAYLNLLDDNDDCAVSLTEVKDSQLLLGLFRPDVSLNRGTTPDSVSCAFSISGKRATFELP